MTTFSQNRRRPGKIVRCQDGRIGVVYNGVPWVNGKAPVYLFPPSVTLAINAKTRDELKAISATKQEATRIENKDKEPEKRLCDPATLKVIGMAD